VVQVIYRVNLLVVPRRLAFSNRSSTSSARLVAILEYSGIFRCTLLLLAVLEAKEDCNGSDYEHTDDCTGNGAGVTAASSTAVSSIVGRSCTASDAARYGRR
jgi:hypothetical protein